MGLTNRFRVNLDPRFLNLNAPPHCNARHGVYVVRKVVCRVLLFGSKRVYGILFTDAREPCHVESTCILKLER